MLSPEFRLRFADRVNQHMFNGGVLDDRDPDGAGPLMSQFQQLRVIYPLAVDRTEVHTYCFRLRGAPERMFQNTISFASCTRSMSVPTRAPSVYP